MDVSVFPPCCLTWGQTMVEVRKIMVTSFKRSHAVSATLTAPDPAAGHHWSTPLLETPRHSSVSQASLGQSFYESESEVAQSCSTLCNPMDYSPPGSSVHRILQARILAWVAISFSRGSSRLGDWARVTFIAPGKQLKISIENGLNFMKSCFWDSICYFWKLAEWSVFYMNDTYVVSQK